MNHYGRQAMAYWQTRWPERLAALTNPEAFFTELGRSVEAAVSEASVILEGTDPTGESYLDKVARLRTIRRTAEEVAMSQLVWEADPDLSLPEAREEWVSVSDSWEGLIAWADRYWEREEEPLSVEVEETARQWAVPVDFLEGLLRSNPPRVFFDQHPEIISEATSIRFAREVNPPR